MNVATLAGFVATSMVLLAIPGPTVALVMSHAMAEGARAVAPLAFGVVLGHLTAMTLSLLGLGAVMSHSEVVFLGLKWLGAVYLVWLGLRLWFASGAPGGGGTRGSIPEFGLVGQAWLVTALNPLSLVFFIALLPQFLDTERRFAPQMMILQMTFLSLAFANALGYGLLAARAGRITAAPRLVRVVRVLAGTMLIGAGTLTLGGS